MANPWSHQELDNLRDFAAKAPRLRKEKVDFSGWAEAFPNSTRSQYAVEQRWNIIMRELPAPAKGGWTPEADAQLLQFAANEKVKRRVQWKRLMDPKYNWKYNLLIGRDPYEANKHWANSKEGKAEAAIAAEHRRRTNALPLELASIEHRFRLRTTHPVL